MTEWWVGFRWYLVIVVIAILLPAIPLVIAIFAGMISYNPAGSVHFSYAALLFLVQILTSGLGEEPGWRGLLPRLKSRSSGQRYIWLLGLFWAVWHYPLVISQTLATMQDVTAVQVGLTILFAFVGQTIALIGITFLCVWIYNYTGSVFLVILFHALTNLITFLPTALVVDQQRLVIIIGFMPWLLAWSYCCSWGRNGFPDQGITNQ